ncbi:MAG: PEP-CTERM sorting domain-containing protein [Pirellulaceae bacterium]|nr:PEP-CTERM sorting domain-containing protein [Planctomycetales bacterium]
MVTRIMCIAALLGCMLSGVAKADYMYSLSFTADGSAAGPFSGLSGSNLSVPVYLVETGTQGAGPTGLANGMGLGASNFDFSSGTSTLTSFSNSLSVLPPTVTGSYQISASGLIPGVAGTPFVGGNSVQVGTLNLTLGPAGSTTIALAASSNPVATNTYTMFTPPAGVPVVNGIAGSFASSTLNVTAVPEPSSLALLTLTACGLVLRRKRNS